MKRTQIQLDQATYEQLRQRAFERGISMSALLREALRGYLAAQSPRPRRESFSFIGAGRSEQGTLAPVSERHDEALVEDYAR